MHSKHFRRFAITHKGKQFIADVIIKHPNISQAVNFLRRNNTLWFVEDLEKRGYLQVIEIR